MRLKHWLALPLLSLVLGCTPLPRLAIHHAEDNSFEDSLMINRALSNAGFSLTKNAPALIFSGWQWTENTHSLHEFTQRSPKTFGLQFSYRLGEPAICQGMVHVEATGTDFHAHLDANAIETQKQKQALLNQAFRHMRRQCASTA